MKKEPQVEVLIELFNQLFYQSENTLLKSGANEPFYRAPANSSPAVIYSREDFYSSALHEIAHWCIAGENRRKEDDFGYWYEPEGRSQEQQTLFEQVEVKPQAIEWLLSLASNHHFNFSADNLIESIDASKSFKRAVTLQAQKYLHYGLPSRAQLLFNQLNRYFRENQTVKLSNV